MTNFEPAPTLMERGVARAEASRWLAVPPAALVALFVGAIVAVLVTWSLGLVLGLVAGAGWFIWRESAARVAVADALGGRPIQAEEFPRLANLVDGLAITTGESAPSVRVIEDAGANLAVAGPSGGAVLVVTTGLLEVLDRIELEAVLAEAFVRIRSHDALLAARVGALVAGPLLGVGPRRTGGRPWRFVGGQQRASLLRRLLGDQREFFIDLAAVEITRYPPALATALAAIQRHGTEVRDATWGTAHCWLAPALSSDDDGSPESSSERLNAAFSFHEPTDHRIAVLAEL